MLGHKQQRRIVDVTLYSEVEHFYGVGKIVKFVLIKIVVLLGSDFRLFLLPKRHHAVKRFRLGIRFVFVLIPFFLIGIFLDARFGPVHDYRIADIIGILPYKIFKIVFL